MIMQIESIFGSELLAATTGAQPTSQCSGFTRPGQRWHRLLGLWSCSCSSC